MVSGKPQRSTAEAIRPLTALFLTQGKALEVFLDVAEVLIDQGLLEKPTFFVSDEKFFRQIGMDKGARYSEKTEFLKEWEIYARGLNSKPDLEFLQEFESQFADPVLWNAVLADRRLSLGKKSSFVQDYCSQYSHEQTLSIVEQTARSLIETFDRSKPDFVVGFICVTLADYLSFLIARKRNIPFINLRPTRVGNFFVAGESVTEPSLYTRGAYERLYQSAEPPQQVDERRYSEATKIIESASVGSTLYEGVIPAESLKQKKRSRFSFGKRLIGVGQSVTKAIKVDLHNALSKNGYDNYYRPGLYWLFLNRFRKPRQLKQLNSICSNWTQVRDQSFAFFPLHKEPEVTMLVYARHCLNQIEVIRNIARSLPVGMKLVVKEHPVAIGYRSKEYYERIVSIPNVVMVKPEIGSEEIIPLSKLVTVISGSIGFEAVVKKIPVITFGDAPFNILPDSMVCNVTDFRELPNKIDEMLSNSSYDQKALTAYVMAVLSEGVPVNFYSGLLEREGAHSTDSSEDIRKKRSEEIQRLAQYIVSRTNIAAA